MSNTINTNTNELGYSIIITPDDADNLSDLIQDYKPALSEKTEHCIGSLARWGARVILDNGQVQVFTDANIADDIARITMLATLGFGPLDISISRSGELVLKATLPSAQ